MIGGANAMWTVRTKWWWRQILVKIVSLLCGLRFLERVAPPLHMGCDMFGGSSSEIYHVFPLKIKRRIGGCDSLMRGWSVHICVRQWSIPFVSCFFVVGGVRSRWHLLYTNSPVKLRMSPPILLIDAVSWTLTSSASVGGAPPGLVFAIHKSCSPHSN